MYFSKIMGFSTIVYSDSVDVSDEDYLKFQDALAQGRQVIGDENGYPIIVISDIEKHRQTMSITNGQARVRLDANGLLSIVQTAIDPLPDNSRVKILFNHEPIWHRADPDLIDICKNHLNLSDEQIDALFQ